VHAFTAYGGLILGRAVCEGYSEAFQYLLHQVGVECLIAGGEGNGQPHQWNIVRIDGEYYHVDVTWNDGNSVPQLDFVLRYYLNMTDSMIARDHTVQITADSYPLPACRDPGGYYYASRAIRIENDGKLGSLAPLSIENALDLRQPHMVFLFDPEATQPQMQIWLQANVWKRNGAAAVLLSYTAGQMGYSAVFMPRFYAFPDLKLYVVALAASPAISTTTGGGIPVQTPGSTGLK
jgi:hypothetical protein